MRVVRLKLKNFIGVYNGMGTKSIELRFDKHNHKFIMIVGQNGSGKTTLINTIHPYSGMYDSSRSKIIREGKKGVKEIDILHGQYMYKIKHYYEPTKTSHTVKSFITKVDMASGLEKELNENGNVRSFNEYVFIELGITPDYMNIIRLGSSMAGFIGESYTERKKYISQFTSESDIFLRHFKRVNDMSRYVNNVIKSIDNKLDRIEDIEVLKRDMVLLNKNIESSKAILLERTMKLGYIESKIHTLDPEGKLKSTYKSNIKKIEKLEKEIDSYGRAYNYMRLDIIDKDIKELEKSNNENESIILVNTANKTNYNESINRLNNIIEDYYIEISKYESDNNLEEVETIYNRFKNIVDKTKCEKPTLSKQEVMNCIAINDDINNTIDAFHDGYSLNFLDSYYDGIYTRSAQLTELMKKQEEIIEELNDFIVHNKELYTLSKQKPSECTNMTCSFIYKLANFDESEYERKKRILDSAHEALSEFIGEKGLILEIIKCKEEYNKIFKYIKRSANLFKPFIQDIPNLDKYIERVIIEQLPFVDKFELTGYIEYIEKYDEYIINLEKFKEIEAEFKVLKENQRHIDFYKAKIDETDNELNKYIELVAKCNKIIEMSQSLIDDDIIRIKTLEKNKDIVIKIDGIKDEIKKLKDEVSKCSDSMTKLIEYDDELNSILDEISNIQKAISISEKQKSEIEYKINNINKFIKEKEVLQEHYKDIEMTKRALSSSKGIPIVFIKLYLQKTKLIANNLLKNAFDGTLRLDDFEVNEKEFRIPCSGKGESNPDVSTASQGEKALIGLSLSFALSRQSSSKYNIMLLDELDGPLDKKHKKIFIDLLDKQMDILGIEQCFIISHSDAFSSMHVGLILLKNHNLDNYNKANVIYEY